MILLTVFIFWIFIISEIKSHFIYYPTYWNVTNYFDKKIDKEIQILTIDINETEWIFHTLLVPKPYIFNTKLLLSKTSWSVFITVNGTKSNDKNVIFSGNYINNVVGIVHNYEQIFYIVHNLDRVNKLSRNTSLVIIFGEEYPHTYRGKMLSTSNNINKPNLTKVCFVKVIVGPNYYSNFINYFLFSTVRLKLFAIRNLIDNSIKYVNMINKQLPAKDYTHLAVEEVILIPPVYCSQKYNGVELSIPKSALCGTTHEDKYLDELQIYHTYSGFCLTIALVSAQLGSTLGYANVGSFCTFSSNRCVLLLNIVDMKYLTNPQLLSRLLAHEVGHLMGARHDEGECLAKGKMQYLMHSDFRNIMPLFSICSMHSFVQHFARINLTDCLATLNIDRLCGNGIIQKEEQCDCGIKESCACCSNKTCKLLATAQCSPFGKDGMCCNPETCQWRDRSENRLCQMKEECRPAKYCTKNGCEEDEESKLNPIKFCNYNTRICNGTFCQETVCEKLGFEVCPSNLMDQQVCHLHCRENKFNICMRFSNLIVNNTFFKELWNVPVYYLVGHRCKDPIYFCTYKGKCESIIGRELTTSNVISMMNPNFTAQLQLYLARHIIAVIIVVVFVMALCVFIFQLPYMRNHLIFIELMFRHFIFSKSLAFESQFVTIPHTMSNEMISDAKFLKIDLNQLQKILHCNPYLLRHFEIFPCGGSLKTIDEVFFNPERPFSLNEIPLK